MPKDDFVIGNEDVLAISVWKEPEISRAVPVRSNAIATALSKTQWNRKAAARLLKVRYRTLLYKIDCRKLASEIGAYKRLFGSTSCGRSGSDASGDVSEKVSGTGAGSRE